jgi:hypothetical protein
LLHSGQSRIILIRSLTEQPLSGEAFLDYGHGFGAPAIQEKMSVSEYAEIEPPARALGPCRYLIERRNGVRHPRESRDWTANLSSSRARVSFDRLIVCPDSQDEGPHQLVVKNRQRSRALQASHFRYGPAQSSVAPMPPSGLATLKSPPPTHSFSSSTRITWWVSRSGRPGFTPSSSTMRVRARW